MREANEGVYEKGLEITGKVDFEDHGITVISGLIYAETEDGILRMDCFYDGRISGKKPAVIWAHGGAFIETHVDRKCRPEDKFLYLAKHGYFVVSVDYRFAQVRPFPCQVEDCKCAVRYLRKNAEKLGVDGEHIAFWGESCGGQLAGLMAVEEGIPEFEEKGGNEGVSSAVQAAVAWYGALDYRAFHDIRAEVDPGYLKAFEVIYGGKPEEREEEIRLGDPMTYVDKKHCPFLCMCSDSDPRVPYQVNFEWCERTRANGDETFNVVVPNQGHGYLTGAEYDQKLYDFLERYLKKNSVSEG